MDTDVSTIQNEVPLVTQKPMIAESIQINELSYEDLTKRFIYSGYTVHVPVPAGKVTSQAWWGINLEGFIPPYNSTHFVPWSCNHAAVQLTNTGVSVPGLYVTQEMIAPPVMSQFISNRFISGQVGVGIRITSQTAQSGNFMVSQASGLARRFYSDGETYSGLRSFNSSLVPNDYMVGSFAIFDVSLNRQFSITGIRRALNKVTDFAFKLHNTRGPLSPQPLVLSSMMAEDWLLFTPMSSLVNSTPNTINLAIFFDYSKVQFYTPMYPILSLPPFDRGLSILNFSSSFNNKTFPSLSDLAWNTASSLHDPPHKRMQVLKLGVSTAAEIISQTQKEEEERKAKADDE